MVSDIMIACHKVVGRHQWDIPLSVFINGDGLFQVRILALFLVPILVSDNYPYHRKSSSSNPHTQPSFSWPSCQSFYSTFAFFPPIPGLGASFILVSSSPAFSIPLLRCFQLLSAVPGKEKLASPASPPPAAPKIRP